MSEAGYDTCNSAIVTNTKFMINVWLGGAFLRPVVFITFEYLFRIARSLGHHFSAYFVRKFGVIKWSEVVNIRLTH